MGITIAVSVLLAWALHLYYLLLYVPVAADHPFMYLHIFIQTFLYTGLFITGHDAMHGNIHQSFKVNQVFGSVSVALFAGMSYTMLRKNHGLHHKYPASEKDPDFYIKSQNFFIWWAVFMWRYLTFFQIVIMAAIYNVLVHLFMFDSVTVMLFWALPAILGTFQLFWVGVYWPHKLPHLSEMGPHKARTQHKNHLWALLSCYFFGYHREHHESPGIAWWKLYKSKG